MPRLSSLQHRDHCYLLLCCTVFVLVVYSCSWIIVVCSWCVWPARGLLVAYSWLLLCDVIVVCAACSWCVHTCGLFVLVVRVIYLWCVRALGLLVLVVCVACSWRARARGLLALGVHGMIVVCSWFVHILPCAILCLRACCVCLLACFGVSPIYACPNPTLSTYAHALVPFLTINSVVRHDNFLF